MSDHPNHARRSPLASTLRLARGWYGSAERRLAWGLTALVVLMTLAQIATALGVNAWNGAFFAALDRRDQAAMGTQAWIFAGLVCLTMALAVAQLYARQMLSLSWRRWLVQHLQGRWARDASNYRMGLLPDAADNPDQRISENTRWATAVSVDLGCSLLYAVINLVSFLGLLWTLSAAVPLAGLAVPGGMLGLAVLYAGAGTLLTWAIGRPLIGIHVDRNRAESEHRFALIRLRENAEAVAMIGGGADEARHLDGSFGSVVGVMRRMLRQERHLMWLGSGYGMVAAALPLLLAGPAFFAGAIGLGALVQLGQAFAEVVRALSWLQEHWPQIADWRSHVVRIEALEDSLDAAAKLGRAGGIAVEPGGERPGAGPRHAARARMAACWSRPPAPPSARASGCWSRAAAAAASPPCSAPPPGSGPGARAASACRTRPRPCCCRSAPICRSARCGRRSATPPRPAASPMRRSPRRSPAAAWPGWRRGWRRPAAGTARSRSASSSGSASPGCCCTSAALGAAGRGDLGARRGGGGRGDGPVRGGAGRGGAGLDRPPPRAGALA